MSVGEVFIFIWSATFLNKKGDITHSESGMAFGRPKSTDELGEYIERTHGRRKDNGVGFNAIRLSCTDDDEEE